METARLVQKINSQQIQDQLVAKAVQVDSFLLLDQQVVDFNALVHLASFHKIMVPCHYFLMRVILSSYFLVAQTNSPICLWINAWRDVTRIQLVKESLGNVKMFQFAR